MGEGERERDKQKNKKQEKKQENLKSFFSYITDFAGDDGDREEVLSPISIAYSIRIVVFFFPERNILSFCSFSCRNFIFRERIGWLENRRDVSRHDYKWKWQDGDGLYMETPSTPSQRKSVQFRSRQTYQSSHQSRNISLSLS